jgi:hypothetical protein
MSTQEFDIPPPGKFVMVFLLVIGLVSPLLIVASILLAAREQRMVLMVLPAAIIFPLIAGVIGWSILKRKIRLQDKALLTGVFGWRRVPVSDLRLDAAAVIDLQQHRDLQPTFKLAGTSMPGYRSGWFWLRDKRRAYVVLTDWRRVLALPKRDGGIILLSLQRPEALLDALRRARG